ILDAGCGAGGPAIDIAQNVTNVKIEGITISEQQAQTAQKLIKQAKLEDRIRIQIGDYHNLPFGDNVFDVVYFFESISYTDNPLRLFSEIYRVLRPGGTIYMKDVFRKEHILSEIEQKDLAEFEKIYAIPPVISLTEMAKILREANFEEVEWHDLSGVVSTEKFVEKMHKSSNGEQKTTNFGKSHYYEFNNLPILFGDIKAYKPVAISPTHHQITPANIGISATTTANNLVVPFNSGQSVSSIIPSNITPSQRSNLVYVLGTLGYDFGTEARRDTFKQLMPSIAIDNLELPSNPYDARQMVDYLESNLSETKSLIWTVNLELTPIYAIKPVGAFAAEIYQVMQYMLAGQILPEANEDYIERVSIPGMLTEETVRLFSGQIVPVIKVNSPRGMYGWKVNTLIESAIETVRTEHEIADEARMRRSLTSFLNRIYYDLRNVGQIARDRALNFAATNAFQAVQTFSQAVAMGMELHSIEVEKSPFCRYGSECWDVKLKFFDPENGLRAKRVFRFTIDVSDRTPVTLGEVRSWAVSK
ncbi:MAG: PatA/PatG family cyanobactin maturation protease, partial [Microcystis sp.]